MYTSNHLATGVLIAAVCPNPWVGIPLAFVSHIASDMLAEAPPRKKEDRDAFMIIEWCFIAIILGWVYLFYPEWWYYAACAVSANLMDVWDKTIGNNKWFHYSWQETIKLTMEMTLLINFLSVVAVIILERII